MKKYVWGSMIIALWCATTLIASPRDHGNVAPPVGRNSMIKPDDATDYVRTDRGVVRGQTVGAVDQFLGIPYAAAPVGDLRWRAPQPAARWHGVREATTLGNACLQFTDTVTPTSEDCLYLNLYRPQKTRPGQSRPVLFWIHGGSNKNGSGNEYDPSEMVEKTGIIVVTINYRLNVFGFLSHPSLDAESDDGSSGNYGLLDQQAALRWVRDNIRAFGGNANHVTIAGESAGAEDVCANLASPTAAGLFKRAIMQSRYCRADTHEAAQARGERVATDLSCTDAPSAAACLRTKAPAELLETSQILPFGPNVSGRVLPRPPLDALRSGQWNQSPILLGTTHDEANLFIIPRALASGDFPMSVPSYERKVRVTFRLLAPAVFNEYQLDNYADPAFAFAAENTDSEFACQVSELARLFSPITKTFQYEFNDPHAPHPTALNIPPAVSLGAYHGSELQYLFKFSKEARGLSPVQEQLSDQMMQYWANFVKIGNPNGAGLVLWPRYDLNTHPVLSLRPGGNIVIDNFDTDHHCEFWRPVLTRN